VTLKSTFKHIKSTSSIQDAAMMCCCCCCEISSS